MQTKKLHAAASFQIFSHFPIFTLTLNRNCFIKFYNNISICLRIRQNYHFNEKIIFVLAIF